MMYTVLYSLSLYTFYDMIFKNFKQRGESVPNQQQSPFHIGLRTAKTAVSAFICIILFKVLHRGSPMLAVLSAVFSLRTDHKQTWKFGISRFYGNMSGGILAIILLQSYRYFTLPDYTDLILVPLGIILLILFCNRFNKTAVINSSATFLVIFYNIEAAVNVEYAIQRVLDTLIGAVIAMIVNRLLPSPHLQEK